MDTVNYINATQIECQNIADRIHYTNMVNQYNNFVWNDEPNNVPKNRATPERIKEIWGASKLFLDCTELEALDQYSLVGFDSTGIPIVPLKGVTNAYAIPREVEEISNWCIPSTENINDYDLIKFDYQIVEN